jgi:selenocysteine lyase/cysteine desulfurase
MVGHEVEDVACFDCTFILFFIHKYFLSLVAGTGGLTSRVSRFAKRSEAKSVARGC